MAEACTPFVRRLLEHAAKRFLGFVGLHHPRVADHVGHDHDAGVGDVLVEQDRDGRGDLLHVPQPVRDRGVLRPGLRGGVGALRFRGDGFELVEELVAGLLLVEVAELLLALGVLQRLLPVLDGLAVAAEDLVELLLARRRCPRLCARCGRGLVSLRESERGAEADRQQCQRPPRASGT
jgi:hypothetical protein